MGVVLTSATTPPRVMYWPEDRPIAGRLAGVVVTLGAGGVETALATMGSGVRRLLSGVRGADWGAVPTVASAGASLALRGLMKACAVRAWGFCCLAQPVRRAAAAVRESAQRRVRDVFMRAPSSRPERADEGR